MIPFMLLARKKGTDQWEVPVAQMFFDLVNTLEKTTVGDQHLNAAMSWTNLWGGVGLIGINSKNFPILQLLRAYINDINVNGYEFCTIPKEGVILNRDLSAMLRGDIANIAPEDFAALLYRRNPGLKGALTVTKCKKFTENDKTKKGQSMKGWRLFELSADDEFLRSLEQFEEGHQFRIGVSSVMIRGGNRPGPSNHGGGVGGSGVGGGKASNGSSINTGRGSGSSNNNNNNNNPGVSGGGSGATGGNNNNNNNNPGTSNVFENLLGQIQSKEMQEEENKKRRRESKESEEKKCPDSKGARRTDE